MALASTGASGAVPASGVNRTTGAIGVIGVIGVIGAAAPVLAARPIARDCAVDELREMRGALDTLVMNELEARCIPQREPPPELAAQKAGGVIEGAAHLLRRVLRGEGGEEDAHASHVTHSADRRDGDVPDPWVLDLPSKQTRQHALDLGLYAVSARLSHRRPCDVIG
jgi:hypothetical protein